MAKVGFQSNREFFRDNLVLTESISSVDVNDDGFDDIVSGNGTIGTANGDIVVLFGDRTSPLANQESVQVKHRPGTPIRFAISTPTPM